MSQATEFTEIYCAPNVAIGDAVRELLVQNGIDCTMNPTVATFPWDGDVRVSCVTTEAARARELIEAYFAAKPEDESEDGDKEDGDDDSEEEDDEEEDEDAAKVS